MLTVKIFGRSSEKSSDSSSVEWCVCHVYTVDISGSFGVDNCRGKALKRVDFWMLAGWSAEQ